MPRRVQQEHAPGLQDPAHLLEGKFRSRHVFQDSYRPEPVEFIVIKRELCRGPLHERFVKIRTNATQEIKPRVVFHYVLKRPTTTPDFKTSLLPKFKSANKARNEIMSEVLVCFHCCRVPLSQVLLVIELVSLAVRGDIMAGSSLSTHHASLLSNPVA